MRPVRKARAGGEDRKLKEHGQEIGLIRKLAFRFYGRHMMNRNVRKVRGGL